MAKLLNLAPGDLQEKMLESIGSKSTELAGRIRSNMFTFEDLLNLDQRGMQRLMREIDSKELALALKGASEEMRRHVKGALSKRAAESLEEEMELLGPVRVRDVEAVHAKTVDAARKLDADGEIMLRGQGEEDEFIE
ncbi:MAG: hypothetical protein GF346_12495 [Candidatus Eisenbacteria bacterium]|nr:hypothetical protein [Candidatus Latescibacterota bacterium]MBD3303256.1 hypothetical protein [Candidatus Eisenbacteria bacterium]